MLRQIKNEYIRCAFNQISEHLGELGASYLTLFFDDDYLSTDDSWLENDDDLREDPVRRIACACEGKLISWNLIGGANARETSILKRRKAHALFNGMTYSQHFDGVLVQVSMATHDENYDFASDFILYKAKQIIPLLNDFIQTVLVVKKEQTVLYAKQQERH